MTVELTVDSLGAQGDGIGRHGGKPVYVAYALPGEVVNVRLRPKGGNAFSGALAGVLVPSMARVEAPCPAFGKCGGCALQHLAMDRYRDWKRDQVATTLATRGLSLPEGTEMTVTVPGTRRRAVFAAAKDENRLKLGFHAAMSSEIVTLDDCLLLVPSLRAALPHLLRLADAGLHNKQSASIQVTETPTGIDVLVTASADLAENRRPAVIEATRAAGFARIAWARGKVQPEPIYMARVPQVVFGGVNVDLPIGAFLQPCAEGEAVLAAAVVAGIGRAKRVADLYSGCGTFSFPLARVARVLAVDAAKPAIAALTGAVNRAQLSGRVEGMVRDLDQSPLPPVDLKPFDAVVFDPPRAGAEMQARMLVKSRVPRVVAVSCNPASFARDARLLVDGGFEMKSVTILDQFLWSHHAELVAAFERR